MEENRTVRIRRADMRGSPPASAKPGRPHDEVYGRWIAGTTRWPADLRAPPYTNSQRGLCVRQSPCTPPGPATQAGLGRTTDVYAHVWRQEPQGGTQRPGMLRFSLAPIGASPTMAPGRASRIREGDGGTRRCAAAPHPARPEKDAPGES